MTDDGIKVIIKTYLWRCRVCDCLVSNPEDHQYHAVIRMNDDDVPPTNPAPSGAGRGTP